MPYDYSFSKGLCSIWGWATWKRAWIRRDMQLGKWPDFKKENKLKKLFRNKNVVKHYEGYFNWIINGLGGANLLWEYRWPLSVLLDDGYYIVPRSNLVMNIGEEGFNYKKGKDNIDNKYLYMEIKDIDFTRFKHPPKIEEDQEFTNALNYEKGFEEPYQKKDFEKLNLKRYIWRIRQILSKYKQKITII